MSTENLDVQFQADFSKFVLALRRASWSIWVVGFAMRNGGRRPDVHDVVARVLTRRAR